MWWIYRTLEKCSFGWNTLGRKIHWIQFACFYLSLLFLPHLLFLSHLPSPFCLLFPPLPVNSNLPSLSPLPSPSCLLFPPLPVSSSCHIFPPLPCLLFLSHLPSPSLSPLLSPHFSHLSFTPAPNIYPISHLLIIKVCRNMVKSMTNQIFLQIKDLS